MSRGLDLDAAEVYRNLSFLERAESLDGSDPEVIQAFADYLAAQLDDFLAWNRQVDE